MHNIPHKIQRSWFFNYYVLFFCQNGCKIEYSTAWAINKTKNSTFHGCKKIYSHCSIVEAIGCSKMSKIVIFNLYKVSILQAEKDSLKY